jgi:hypothetical protein
MDSLLPVIFLRSYWSYKNAFIWTKYVIKIYNYPLFAPFDIFHFFTPRENNRLLDYYKIISISRPILARANMGLDFVSGQYGFLFSRCRKYVINSLIRRFYNRKEKSREILHWLINKGIITWCFSYWPSYRLSVWCIGLRLRLRPIQQASDLVSILYWHIWSYKG